MRSPRESERGGAAAPGTPSAEICLLLASIQWLPAGFYGKHALIMSETRNRPTRNRAIDESESSYEPADARLVSDLLVGRQKERPSFEQIYMELAQALAQRSTCSRLNVGTVITSTDYRKVLAVGYNGNATGLPNQCDRREAGNCGCLHSEENAVINCDSPRAIEKVVFVTHLPCAACAKRLINLGGVKKVFYRSNYRSAESLRILDSVGITTVKLES